MSIAIDARRRAFHLRMAEVLPRAMLAGVLLVSLVILLLLAVILWLSWLNGSPGNPVFSYGWQNYIEVFSTRQTFDVLMNTFGFSGISLAVALVFGIPAAWVVERSDFRGKTTLFTLMTIGLIIPGFASAMGWLFLLNPRIGVVNIWLMQLLGLTRAPFNIATITGMGWVQGLNLAPVAFIMTAAVFRAMDPSLEEAAQMGGGGFLTTLRRITLPLAWPGIMAASIYIFTIGFAAFDVPAIIGWSNRIFTFSTYVYLLIDPQDVLPRYGVAAALSTTIMGIAALLSWWYSAMQQRSRQFAVISGKAYRPRMVKLGWFIYPVWMFFGLYFALSTFIPIIILGWSSLLPYFQPPSATALSLLSFRHYATQPWGLVLTGAKNTAVLMILTPTVTLALALAFSWVVLRSRIVWRGVFDFIAFLPHAIPNIIFGVGALLVTLYLLQRTVPIYGTIWLLLLVFTIARLSYATRMTNSGLMQIHTELEESAQMSGASLRHVFKRVLLPLLSPTLLYAWLWIALLVFRELTLAVIVSAGGNITMPVVVWSLWLGGGMGESSALTMIMLVVMVPIIAVYWMVARRQGVLAES